MSKRVLSESVWRTVAGELRDVASWLARRSNCTRPSSFASHPPHARGRKGPASRPRHRRGQVLENGRVHFELRSAADERLCATLDYDSASHAFSVDRLSG